MRCRVRRTCNLLIGVCIASLLMIFVFKTYIHVSVPLPDNHQYINVTRNQYINVPRNSTVEVSFENRTAGTRCDEECNRFRQLLQSWSPTKQKAVIYLLVQKSSMKLLKKSLYNLDRFFNNRFHYPVVIFCEQDMFQDVYQRRIRSFTNSTIFFQQVVFQLPSFLTEPVPPEIIGRKRSYGIGYRHMCRFHAKTVYDEPILSGVQYAWRLDDDSFITRDINYDVFQLMHDHNITYGFIKIFRELHTWTTGLWHAAIKYIKVMSVKTQFFNRWPRNGMYYNNFEISRLSVWLSDDYQRFINYIDQLGGIYYHRWGDAPIKSIAVSMFVPYNQTYHFKDIGYRHQFFHRR